MTHFSADDMRQIGEINISPIGLGTVKFGRNTNVKYPHPFDLPSLRDLRVFLDLAHALGVNFIDTAPAYGESENRLGQLIAKQRHHWIISTKVGEDYQGSSVFNFSSKHTRLSIEKSMKKLRTEYLDIVFIHCNDNDLENLRSTDVISSLRVMQEKGYIRYIGASTKTLAGGSYAIDNTDLVMVSNTSSQLPVLERARTHKKPTIIKKPLQSGFSTNIHSSIKKALAHPSVASIIVGSINKAHLRDNIKYATSL